MQKGRNHSQVDGNWQGDVVLVKRMALPLRSIDGFELLVLTCTSIKV